MMGVSRLIFKFQAGGARDLDGQYSTDLRLLVVLFFLVYSPSPQRGTYKEENTEIIAAEINNFLCFILVFL